VRPEEVRAAALALPEAEERETWGEATFRVRNRIFVIMGSDGERASVKASLDEQDELVSSDAATFSVSDYTGRFGWVTVELARVDPDEMRDLISDAWRRTAPKRLVARFDAGG
jgi:hypothetical protein